MHLRDLSLFLLLAVLVVAAVRRPYIGVLGWVPFSVMNPHRLAWGGAYNFQFAQVIAIATLLGLLFSRDEKVLNGGPPAVILVVPFAWCAVNTALAFSPTALWEYLGRTSKLVDPPAARRIASDRTREQGQMKNAVRNE